MSEQVKIWIDALEFEEKGGWKTDTQYVHLMGCGYLLAANEPGIPVADAKTVVNVPKKDTPSRAESPRHPTPGANPRRAREHRIQILL